MPPLHYDIFISHASEDKMRFVAPLALELRRLGLEVWYDDFALRPGDSIRQAIDQGLVHSWHGAVVISKAFITKKWPNWETNGLVQSLSGHASRRLIPVWFEVSHKDVSSWSPSIADIKAVVESDPIRAAKSIFAALEGDTVIAYRSLANEQKVNVQVIQAVEAALNLLCTSTKHVSYALYRVERTSHPLRAPTLRLVTERRNPRFDDCFRMIIPSDTVQSAIELGQDYPVLTSEDRLFSAIIVCDHTGRPLRNALKLVTITWNASEMIDVRPTAELLLALLAPEPSQFRRDDRETSQIATLLGGLFLPYFLRSY